MYQNRDSMINFEFKSVRELIAAFPDEQTCINHLEELRWNGNVVSPFDENSKVYKCAGNKYKCKNTGKYFNVRTNTLFDNTKIELQTWFVAIYLLTGHKKGISSLQLSRDLNITQKSAWFMAQRIRACFGITPEIEDDNTNTNDGGQTTLVDESFIGGKNKNRHKSKKVEASQGRSFKDKTPVVGLLEQEVSYTIERAHKVIAGRIVKEKIVTKPAIVKCVVIPDTKGETIKPIIKDLIVAGTTVVTDEWLAYNGLSSEYNHQVVDHKAGQYVNETGHTTNTVEGFWTTFKRSYIGIYHYMSRKHLQRYANEMTFRYNSRHISGCTRFNLLLSNLTNRTTYKALTNG